MAWHIEKNPQNSEPELVIDGFSQGIADSPYMGIADMRNMNINSWPEEASVMFATAECQKPPSGVSAVAFSADAGTDVFTWAGTATFYNGMAVTINTVSMASQGVDAGTTYYVGNVTSTTFKLYDNLILSTVINVASNITGTFTVPTFGTPTDSTSIDASLWGNALPSGNNPGLYASVIMTSNALLWLINPSSLSQVGGSVPLHALQFLGNTGHSAAAGGSNTTGVVEWNDYLFVFPSDVDYLPMASITTINPSEEWAYAWETASSDGNHRAIAATDDAVYFCNDQFVGSILVKPNQTFDPTNTATYTYNSEALKLPSGESSRCLAQLGVTLLVGGVQNYIYPWDRVSPSFSYPLIVPESFIKCIVSTNSTAYIFAGNRGRIFLTNGANIDEFKKFPDALTGTVEPYYTWGWGIYKKNQLYFSIAAANNSNTTIDNFAGIWAIDLTTGALRLSNSLSFGTYTGTVPTLIQMGQVRPTGDGVYAAWVSGSSTGVDYTSATPYTTYQAFIDTDIINVGTFITPTTFSNIEFKLGKPLVTGESVRIRYRSNLTDSFTTINTTTTVGLLSDAYSMNFQNVQWIQFRVLTSSTASTPSYVPLKELRIRP